MLEQKLVVHDCEQGHPQQAAQQHDRLTRGQEPGGIRKSRNASGEDEEEGGGR